MNSLRLFLISLVALVFFSIILFILAVSSNTSENSIQLIQGSVQKLDISSSLIPLENHHAHSDSKNAYDYSDLFSNLPKPNLNHSNCKIALLDFTEEEFNTKWDYKKYEMCKTPANDEFSIINSSVIARCANGKEASIYLEDTKTLQTLGGSIPSKVLFTPGNTQPLGKSQFSIINCNNIKYPLIHTKLNPSVSLKSQQIRYSISNSSKPLSVLILIFDSISMQSAHRNLPLFTSLLNSQFKDTPFHEKFVSYEFTKVNSENPNTMDNIIPIFYGEDYEEHLATLKNLKASHRRKSKLTEYQKKALWSYYSELGYVTMFSYDTVYNYLSKSTGSSILADHVFTNFWRVAMRVFGYNDFLENQRCLGRENAHFYSLNYTYQFFQNYKNHNRFAYSHISAAHEDTGNVRTVDNDLVKFVKNIMSIHHGADEDLLMFIISDHGRNNKNLKFNIKMLLDHKRPMTFIVMNKELDEKIGGEILKHNQNQLVGRFDMHLSLKSIAKVPYGEYVDANYTDLKEQYNLRKVVSLFHEKISISRTCVDLLLKETFCICKDFENIDFENSNEREIISILLNLTKYYISDKLIQSDICEEAEIRSIISAKKFRMDEKSKGWATSYFLEVETQFNNQIHINATFVTVSKYPDKITDITTPKQIALIEDTEVLIYLNSVYVKNYCKKLDCIC